MNNYITFTLEEIYCIPFRNLYKDDSQKAILNSYAVHWSFVYFITQRPKYRFLDVRKKGHLIVASIVNRHGDKHQLEAKPDLLLGIKESFEWVKKYQPEKYEKVKEPAPIFFNPIELSDTEITIYVNNSIIDYFMKIDIERFIMHGDPSASFFKFLKPAEIVYIGQTLKKEKRFFKHEKLQKAVSLCDEDMEVHIWPTLFRTDFLIYKNSDKKEIFESNKADLDIDKNKIDLLEVMLIDFFQPRFNTQAKKIDFLNNKIINHHRLNGAYGVALDWGVVEPYAQLQCSNQKLSNTDHAYFLFDHSNEGYSSELVYYKDGEKFKYDKSDNQAEIETRTRKRTADFFGFGDQDVLFWNKDQIPPVRKKK